MATDSTDAGRTTLPVVPLEASRGAADTVTATVPLAFGQRPMHLEIVMPTGPVRPIDLLPVYQGLTNLVVDAAVEAVERHGERVSCAKGCGACCRQPVPVSPSEAHALA